MKSMILILGGVKVSLRWLDFDVVRSKGREADF